MEGALFGLPHQVGQFYPARPALAADRQAKHPREVPVSQLLPRPRSLLQVVPVSGGE